MDTHTSSASNAAPSSGPHVPNDRCAACETVDTSRRGFFTRGALATATLLAAPALLTRKAGARPPTSPPSGGGVLVHVFLRGGSDGLSMFPPYADANYYAARPTIAVAQPGQLNGAIPIPGNSYFGLAPAAASLLTPYNAGKLLVVHASGLDDPTRSHFDAQRLMELGTTSSGTRGLVSGWVARHLSSMPPAGSGGVRAVALEDGAPDVLDGAPASLAIKQPELFVMPGRPQTAAQRLQALGTMYSDEREPLGPLATTSAAGLQLLSNVNFGSYVPANNAVYPSTSFGNQLRSTAAMIKGNLGIEVFAIDYDRDRGWDHHAQANPIVGAFATKLRDLSRGLEAFYLDLRDTHLDQVTVLVYSEFGRRVAQNASNGTDHGHGNALLVMGGRIVGGQILTQWPGLAPSQLDDGDLAITIDHRDILAEIVQTRLGNPNTNLVFPGYTPQIRGIAY